MNHLMLLIFLLTSHAGSEACLTDQVPDKDLQLYRLFVEVGQIKMWEPTDDDTQEYNEEDLGIEEVGGHQVRKRGPRCLLSCLKQKVLHPAQCHSYCRFHFG